METGYFFGSGLLSVKYFELGGKGVVVDETVYHFHAFSFHGMLFA